MADTSAKQDNFIMSDKQKAQINGQVGQKGCTILTSKPV